MPPSGGEMLKGRFLAYLQVGKTQPKPNKQARKPRSYASLKLRPSSDLLTYSLTRVKCRATSVAKKARDEIFMQETTLHGYRYLAKGGISTFIWFGRLPHHRKWPLNNIRKLISYMCLFCKYTFRSLILVATTSGSAYAFYFHVGKTLKTIKKSKFRLWRGCASIKSVDKIK